MNARILLLPGDGIGPEVVAAAAHVLRATATRFGHSFDLPEAIIGATALRTRLPPLPDETLAAARAAHAVLLGAVGDPEFDRGPSSGRPEAALLGIRKALGLYANLRPARVWPGLESSGPLKPEVLAGTDMLVVRELTGGLYYGEPRGIAADNSSAHNTMRYSRGEIERIARRAFDAARLRRKRVTSVDKANVLETSRLWRAVVTEVAADYPDVALDHMLVDSCAMRIALAPSSFDVIVTENMFGDILSDEAGAVVGSLGLLPSASLGEGTGLFEPVHGSAPDIAGRNVANPIGAIASAAMLLRHALGLEKEAAAVEQAVEKSLRSGLRTADLAQGGPSVGTVEMAEAVVKALG
ncbi:MAG TPA: 3-isopropylmalate dehydrogenase [Vicinamibacterales bacterium]|nr:3-isopropylmalate dehydrogenase [Vicinamibacterales bacterium]